MKLKVVVYDTVEIRDKSVPDEYGNVNPPVFVDVTTLGVPEASRNDW